MVEDGWVFVKKLTDRDVWIPTGMMNLEEEEEVSPLEIRFNGDPAKHWTDALPIGNGRLGGMVWGGIPSDLININEDTLWTGTPGDYTDPEIPNHLVEVRKLVDDGKYSEATQASYKLTGKSTAIYQLVGDIKIEFDNSHGAYNKETYERILDLDTATAKVKYSVGEVEFTREYFSSSPDQVIAMKISGSKTGCLNFTISLDSLLQHQSNVVGNNQIEIHGTCPADGVEGIRFSAILDLQIGGSSATCNALDNGKLQVESSDWAIVYLVASSSYDGPFTKPSDSTKDPSLDALEMLRSVKKFSYYEVYDRHIHDYQNLFHRVSLKLSKALGNGTTMNKCAVTGTCQGKAVSTADRVKSFSTDEDPNLVELLFQYGRYLLIACSRPGTQPANLQGIWNKDIGPAWGAAPHLNINLQMNYWPSLPCNLRECQEPLFDCISDLSVNGRKTAEVNYKAQGWVTHQITDLWAKTSPDSGDPVWAIWPMGGAWLCTHLWEHYTYTMDMHFLENKAYPLFEGCCTFMLDWLLEGHGSFLETNPSTSPEHKFIAPDGKVASVSYSTTMDVAIIREVFSATLSAAEVLGKTKDGVIERVRRALPRLPPTKIARDGSIMEWAVDFEDAEVHHRHISHLFGLFPGHTITNEKNSDLCKAAENTLFKRGEDGPGWSTAWKTAVWARLHNSEHAYRMVKHLFRLIDPLHETRFEGGLYSNLFAAHPPFQIDANLGFPAAVAEMLVQSTLDDLYLLPALPRDKWPSGCVKGLKARGDVSVSICWSGGGDLHQVGIWSKHHKLTKRLHYNGDSVTAQLSPGTVYTFDKQLKCLHSCPL